MGLREKKARRNRDRIVNEAMALFTRDGYEQTTMEAIAEAAEVSPSTLYRYFPSKDLIVLAKVTANAERFSETFAASALRLPVDQALAEAIFAGLVIEDHHPSEVLMVRRILDQSPIARAKLWDYLAEQRQRLAQQLAKRLHAKEDDLHVIFAARLAILIAETSADIWRATGGLIPSRATAEQLMQLMLENSVVLPRPTPMSQTATDAHR